MVKVSKGKSRKKEKQQLVQDCMLLSIVMKMLLETCTEQTGLGEGV
jgi:hypothetical protein